MTEFLAHLKQRKLMQWAIACVAFAFALIQVLSGEMKDRCDANAARLLRGSAGLL